MTNWALHNALRGWTLYDLTVGEVQLLVQVMSANEIKLSKVCLKNASKWSALTEDQYPEFFTVRKVSSGGYPAVHQSEKNDSDSDTDTEYFVVRPRKQLPRLHQRHDIAVRCVVLSTTKSFETESFNLSEGGLQFKEALPDWIAGYFIVGVKTSHGMVQLMCSLVEDQKEKKRVQIVSEDTDPQFIVYRDWLATLP